MTKVIQFSGGMDSIAMLWLLRPIWDEATVMWLDSGAAYPETHEQMEKIAALVPNFLTVKGNQPAVIGAIGYPVDVVPFKFTVTGELIHGPQPVRYQTSAECCGRSMWVPMSKAAVDLGATEIYRGQRNSEARKSPIRDGNVENGITYRFPLQSWTRADVSAYVNEHCPELMPAYYKAGERTSRDCWDCTAYLDDNHERIAGLPTERKAVVMGRLNEWRQNVAVEMAN